MKKPAEIYRRCRTVWDIENKLWATLRDIHNNESIHLPRQERVSPEQKEMLRCGIDYLCCRRETHKRAEGVEALIRILTREKHVNLASYALKRLNENPTNSTFEGIGRIVTLYLKQQKDGQAPSFSDAVIKQALNILGQKHETRNDGAMRAASNIMKTGSHTDRCVEILIKNDTDQATNLLKDSVGTIICKNTGDHDFLETLSALAHSIQKHGGDVQDIMGSVKYVIAERLTERHDGLCHDFNQNVQNLNAVAVLFGVQGFPRVIPASSVRNQQRKFN